MLLDPVIWLWGLPVGLLLGMVLGVVLRDGITVAASNEAETAL
jgi:F0F1-type ATP synthase assembly protein I